MQISFYKKIKELFKKFYPIPTKSFIREINNIHDILNLQQKALNSMLERSELNSNEVRQQYNNLHNRLENTESKINEIMSNQRAILQKEVEIKGLSSFKQNELIDLLKNIELFLNSSMKKISETVKLDKELIVRYENKLTEIYARISELKDQSKNYRAYIDSFENQFNDANAGIKSVVEANKQLNAIFWAHQDELNSISENINLLKKEPERIINATANRINPASKAITYTLQLERRFYKNSFGLDIFNAKDFPEKLQRLFSGLDEKSISTVARSLSRLRKIVQYEKEKVNMDIYTAEEQEFFNTELQKFNLSIFQLSDSLFLYNGYYLPLNHFEYCVFGDLYGIKNFTDTGIFKNRDIIDAGAFIGDSALILSSFTEKKVYSFEPSPTNYAYMLETIKLNNKDNIIPLNMALGAEKNIQIEFNLSEQITCCSVEKNDGFNYTSTIKVDSTTLDDFVDQNRLSVGLIKVDIEGEEQNFLKGAIKTITKQKPTLIISIYHSADDFFEIKPMLENLNLGYVFKIYHPPITTVFTETVLLAECLD